MKNIKLKILSFLFISVFSVFGSGVFALNTVYAISVSQCYSADFPSRTIVEFDGGKIRSDMSEAEAFKTESVSLTAGTYDIILVASDSYPERVSVSQPNESWKLILKNGATEIGITGATPDLADLIESDTETLNIDNFIISSAVDTAVAYHAVYPDASSANSVQPVCAGFDLVNDEDGNDAPVANAGPDQTITLPTNQVTLDGTQSDDTDGTISSFVWSFVSGPSNV